MPAEKLIIFEPQALRDAFDRVPIKLSHDLAATGLFTFERMAALVDTIIAANKSDQIYLLEPLDDPGKGTPKTIFRKVHPGVVAEIPNTRQLLGIRDPGAVVPAYREVYREVVREAGRLLGQPLLEHSRRGQMTALVSSPGVVTAYHIDFGHNFLCQVLGTKEVSLWRPDDRATLSDVEIEHFYCGNSAAARWRPEAQPRALRFQLIPGDALYQPPLAPHWVKNGPAVSIGVSITFSTPAIVRRSRIYQANPYVRRLGVTLPPPGRSGLADGARLAVTTAVTRWKHLQQRARKWTGAARRT